MRRIALAVAALCASTAALAGCASEPTTTEVSGPNGYALVGTLADGSELWWDRSPESGATDVIVESPEGTMMASCLSAAPLLCVAGPDSAPAAIVIAPEGGERAVVTWYGTPVELTRGEVSAEGAVPVFAGIMPARAAEGAVTVQVLDAAGGVVWEQ